MTDERMATSDPPDSGAPIPRDAIDPELVKLARPRSKIGMVTALGVVVLCVAFALRLSPDRRFGGEGDKPQAVALGDVTAGKIDVDRFIEIEADVQFSHAMRAGKFKTGDLGVRLAPARGTNDRLWLALPDDPWDPPTTNHRYSGRLRRLSDVQYGAALADYAARHPRPVFAAPAAVRSGFATNRVTTLTGDEVAIADGDRVVIDLVEPNRVVVVATLSTSYGDAAAWVSALAKIELRAVPLAAREIDSALRQVRFEVAGSVAVVTKQIGDAKLWGVRVEPMESHYETTWHEFKQSKQGLRMDKAELADRDVELVAIYARRDLPSDAYALLTSERPADYWYVLPTTILLAVFGMLFGWALVRAVRHDLLAPRA